MFEITPGHKYYNIGVPTVEEPKLYALYCPILDKILLLVNNKEYAIKLCILISSKIHVIPIRIDESTNYSVSLLDNSCCLNWKLSASELMKLWECELINFVISPTFHKLFESNIRSHKSDIEPSNKMTDDLTILIRNFLYLSLWTLEQIDDISSLYTKYSYGLISVLPNGIFDNFYKMRLKCTETIYHGIDFEQTCSTVEETLEKIIETLP